MKTLSLLPLALALAACGGGGSNEPVKTAVNGSFVDAAVEGAEYIAGTAAKAATGSKGEFTCKEGDSVSFSVGGMALGSAACAPIITPLQLAGVADVKDARVVNRLLALQLLDEDNDPSNGIRITTAVKTALAGKTADFSAAAADFNKAMAANLAVAGAAYAARGIDDERRLLVREHFEDTLASKVGTLVPESFTRVTRCRPPTASTSLTKAATPGSRRTSRSASCRPTVRRWPSKAPLPTATWNSTG
jgi:hypothetical protein